MIHCQLWMGSLEPYMTESFVMHAFHKMGEHPQNVKIMRNKYSGEQAGYCFVHFATDEAAIDAMHKLNGKPIPGTNPVVRFRLNNASSQGSRISVSEREFSVWVGDLSSDVDDYNLYRAFAAKYSSIKTAKVILDSSGFSKGYGFVRFGSEDEQKNALYAMNGYIGLGTTALKICNAVPKPKGTPTTTSTNGTTPTSTYGTAVSNTSQLQVSAFLLQQPDYTQYYDPSTYWQNYSAAWQSQGYYDASASSIDTSQMPPYQTPADHSIYEGQMPQETSIEDELALVEHKIPVDLDQMNRELMDRDRNLWDALESSKWLPLECLDAY